MARPKGAPRVRLDARIAPETQERLAALCSRFYPGEAYALGRIIDRAIAEMYEREQHASGSGDMAPDAPGAPTIERIG